jgi:hypothetical protein
MDRRVYRLSLNRGQNRKKKNHFKGKIEYEKKPIIIAISLFSLIYVGCSTNYNTTPLPFKTPAAFPNMVNIEGSQIAAKSSVDANETKEAFGFLFFPGKAGSAKMLRLQIRENVTRKVHVLNMNF